MSEATDMQWAEMVDDMQDTIECLLEALEAIQLSATNHGGEFENDPTYLLTLIHNMASLAIAKARGQ